MKLFKNRTVLGIFCIAVSLIICFAITPLVNAGLSKKVTIVRFNRQVNEGEEITRSMLDEVEVGNHNLPENVIRNIADVEGKYLTATVYAGDYILTDKISDEPAAENKYLYSLNGEKQAMSITINTFAEGLSGKLKSGDIVSVIAPDYLGSGETIIPVELKYVEVIAVTAKSGYDANTGEKLSEEDEKELPSTVTILVRQEQSKLLARLEAEGEIHLSLVFRGDADKASEFIKAQDQVLDEIKAAEEEGKQLSKTLDAFYMDGAVKIAKYIRMNDYKKNRMANVLRASGLGMTPEVYTAYAYLKAGSVFLLIIPALHVFPLAALFVILLGIMIYYKEIQKADEMLKEKREQIEEELYRFVSTITQELKNSRDVLSMLEHYKENAGAAFRKELDIVCADMRSSSYEAALTRFEARLNSPQLSDVVRGLIGVLRGDDGAVYFQMLTHDFKQTELQRLKAKAAKIPPKIRVYSFAMLMCFLATYFAIIIYEIIRSMGTLF